MSELRAALEAAIAEEWPEWHGETRKAFVSRLENCILAWLKEKAGEEPKKCISVVLDEWLGESEEYEGNLDCALLDALSPLFAALRVRAEEAEALAEKRAEDTDRIRRERDRWRENCMATARGLREADTQIESLRLRAEEAERQAQESDAQVERSGRAAYEQGFHEGYKAAREDAREQ